MQLNDNLNNDCYLVAENEQGSRIHCHRHRQNRPPESCSPPQPSPLQRTTTATTWGLSSCSSTRTTDSHSSQTTDSGSRFSRQWKQSSERILIHNRHDQFYPLYSLGKRYRERCLIWDQRRFECQLQLQCGAEHQILCRLIEREALVKRSTVAPAGSNLLPSKHLVRNADSRLSLREEATSRKHEASSDENKKLPARTICSPRTEDKGNTGGLDPDAAHGTADRPPPMSPFASLPQGATSDFGGIRLDREELRRQQEILDEIERQYGRRKPCRVRWQTPANSRRCPVPVGTARAIQNSPGLEMSSSMRGSAPLHPMSVDDHVTRLANGTKIQVKGTRHTYESIIMGHAKLVQCPACQTVLQIGDTAKKLYCTACQQVSSIRRIDVERPASAVAQGKWDSQIASVLQRQEINVVRTLKQAKRVAG
ncbi:expressed unknown protein [Seminavis robusta]|uniref:Uncharacterized protein n=1 Tax=Seminavis robusta TaxID=568900 RepID=A0A9N8E2K2_9STRA|nr:expressed unknown protein [Seminavis robusta]|eukprot:Sro586_g171150.1 n/a (424) ;mRNA; f:23992-25263